MLKQGVRRLAAAVGMALGIAAAAPPAVAEDPAFLAFGAGVMDVGDEDTAAQFDVQWRPDLKLWFFQLMIGANASTESTAYVYAGISLDLFFGNRIVLRPSFAPGLYHEGDGKDLGHALEFRSALELAWRFDDRSRLGLELSHRSNLGIGDDNPGEESLTLFYHLPLTGR